MAKTGRKPKYTAPERKLFWLSFCDSDRPKGSQFLGVCIVEVTSDEAADMLIELVLRFPHAQDGAEWIAAASRKAHRLGCNPGGQMAAVELLSDAPQLQVYQLGVLMDRATIEAIDEQLETMNSQ